MSRLYHSAVSFTIVLVAYWIYVLAAVPLIEPSIAGPAGTTTVGGFSEPGDDQRIKQLEGLFPPGTLDRNKTKVLENDKVILLLNEYKNLGDGRVELNPCTMVFPWDGPAEDETQRKRQAIILEAPQGAILKFNESLDLGRFRIGRLESGSLRGPIIIRSQGKSPGPEDDLLISTRDVQFNEQEASTPHPVEFTWGRNSGSGQDMHIKLLADPSKVGNDTNAPKVAGVEVFEMRSVKRLHLESPPRAPAGRSHASSPSASNQTDGFTSPAAVADLPVEITCKGAFTFNVVKRVATFANNVNVSRINPNGPSDQIQCEQLSIYFAQRDKTKPETDNSSDLEPERIEARGYPVVITAPTQNLTGQGERLEYNIKSNLISLDGGPNVFLQQGANEIHGRSLKYQSLGPNRLGMAAAEGPGWFCGQMADKPDQRLEARWNDQLRLFPQDQNHVISFTGGAILDYAGIGHMEAKEIFFWLKETPPGGPPGQPRIQPDRMMARDQVTVNSAQLSANVAQLEVWFEKKGSPQGIRWKDEDNAESPLAMPGAPAYLAPAVPADQSRAVSDRNDADKQHFKISGRILRARIQLQDQQSASLAEITIEDGVSLEETQTLSPDERPILIQGDRLHGADVSSPIAVVNVTGKRAHFEGRGLGLSGSNINLNRGTNCLWIDGPGRMDLPLSSNMIGQSLVPAQPITVPGTLCIEWKKKMLFDGNSAKFEESVSAATPQQHLQTEILEVKLKSPINFSDPNMQNQTEVEELLCHGGVFLENRSTDAWQQPASYDCIQVADLAVNLRSGALSALGPGWINSVMIGSNNPNQNQLGARFIAGRPAPQAVNNAAAVPAQPNNQLNCLHVTFQRSITGNILQKELIFNEHIRAVYAPVFDWTAMIDPDKQQNLGPKAITLHCNQLKVNQMPLPAGNGQSIEVEASGNAVAEGGGGVFTARAHLIKYAEAKDLLILEGDGRTDAELFQQPQPGAEVLKTAARKFQYNLKTKSIKIDDARSSEFIRGKN